MAHPAQIKIAATYLRGGTSKGVFFRLQDLPAAAQVPGAARDALLLRVIGSPDPYGKQIDGKKLVFVSILRAGNGILDGVLSVVPGARVGHIGLYRDPATLQAVEYYFKMPKNMEERDIVIVDPMLATGNSAVAAVTRLKACHPKSIKFLCLLTCPEGINALHQAHPDVPVFT
eukprot:gene35855-58869_t